MTEKQDINKELAGDIWEDIHPAGWEREDWENMLAPAFATVRGDMQKAIEAIGHEIDKHSKEAELAGSDRATYLWGLNDGYRHAIEILTGVAQKTK